MIRVKDEKKGTNKGWGKILLPCLLLFGVGLFSPWEAFAIQITGLVELETDFTETASKTADTRLKSKNTRFIQRYQVGLTGILLDPRFASYTVTIGVHDSTDKTEPFAGQSTRISRDTLTYGLQMNLFRVRWPVVLYAQRNIIETETAGDLITDTFSLSWIMSLRRLPTLRVTLLQLGSDFQDPANPRETRMRLVNIGLNQQMRNTNLDFTYQLQNFMVKSSTEDTDSTVNSFTFRGETSLDRGVFAHANLTYFPEGSVFAPGLTTASETTGGVGVLHQIPNFSQSANYEFFDASGTDFKRNIFSYNVNYRPLGKTDYHGDLVYSSSSSTGSDTRDYRVSGGVNHRPFFGLSLNGAALVNHNESSGQTSSSRDRFGTNLGINYFKPLTYFHFNSGAAVDYGVVEAGTASEEGQVWTSTAVAGLTTRTLQTTKVNGTYTFLHREDTITQTANRDEHTFHLGVLDSTFRRLILKADTDLQFTDNSDGTDSAGIEGTTFLFDSRADYFPILNLSTSAGFRYSDFPKSSATQDVTTYFAEGEYFFPLTRKLYLTLSAHWDRESYRFIDRDRYRLNSLLIYQIGKITTSVEYRNEVTKYPQTRYTVQSVFLRASRPF